MNINLLIKLYSKKLACTLRKDKWINIWSRTTSQQNVRISGSMRGVAVIGDLGFTKQRVSRWCSNVTERRIKRRTDATTRRRDCGPSHWDAQRVCTQLHSTSAFPSTIRFLRLFLPLYTRLSLINKCFCLSCHWESQKPMISTISSSTAS